jgi:hypothetical protein
MSLTCGLRWRRADSNRRPPACKAGALPAELRPPVCPRILRTMTLHTAPKVDHLTAPDRQSRDARRGHERFHGTKCRRRAPALHLWRGTASDEELGLPAVGLAVKLGRNKRRGFTAPAASERNVAPAIDARNSLRTWWDGERAEPGPVYACSMAAVANTCPVGEVTARLSKRVRSA